MDATDPDEAEVRGRAYHEAGHAVVALLFGMTLHEISILDGKPGTGGSATYSAPHPILLSQQDVFFEGTIERDRYVCHQIMVIQAGEVSQNLFCPETLQPYHAAIDQAQLKRLIVTWDRYASRDERDEKIDDLFRYTKQLLFEQRCAAAIHAVAQVLLEKKKITGTEAGTLIRNAITKTMEAVRGLPARIQCPHCTEYDE